MTQFERFAELHLDVRGEVGNELLVLCPFHDDHSPSMYLNKVSGLWICHACGTRGSAEALSERLLGVPLGRTAKAEFTDLNVAIERLEETKEEPPPIFYPEKWLEFFDFPTDYWTEVRGFSPEIVEKFRLGFDPFNEEATIPLRDETGAILGVIRRRFGEGPRYIHPSGVNTANYLFGAWLLEGQREVFLVEGPLDAVALWDVGIPALAFFGSSLKRLQANLLRRLGVREVVIWPDNDEVGRIGVENTENLLTGIMVNVVNVQNDWPKDAGDVDKTLRSAYAEDRSPSWGQTRF